MNKLIQSFKSHIAFARKYSYKNILELTKLYCLDSDTQISQMTLAALAVCCETHMERKPSISL